MPDGSGAFFDVAGRRVLITGAASGIGAAVAKRFVEAGATVIAADLHPAPPDANAGMDYVEMDVASEASVSEGARQLAGGPIDVLVNNAGVAFDEGELAVSDLARVRRTLEVNLLGVIHMMKYFGPLVRNGGAIVNTASAAASIGFPGYGAYAASKGGVVALTRVAAMEFGTRDIRVNAICPGTIETPMEPGDSVEAGFARRASPFGRIGQTDDLVGLFHFLASEEARFITGQAIYADGGVSAGFPEAMFATANGEPD